MIQKIKDNLHENVIFVLWRRHEAWPYSTWCV